VRTSVGEATIEQLKNAARNVVSKANSAAEAVELMIAQKSLDPDAVERPSRELPLSLQECESKHQAEKRRLENEADRTENERAAYEVEFPRAALWARRRPVLIVGGAIVVAAEVGTKWTILNDITAMPGGSLGALGITAATTAWALILGAVGGRNSGRSFKTSSARAKQWLLTAICAAIALGGAVILGLVRSGLNVDVAALSTFIKQFGSFGAGWTMISVEAAFFVSIFAASFAKEKVGANKLYAKLITNEIAARRALSVFRASLEQTIKDIARSADNESISAHADQLAHVGEAEDALLDLGKISRRANDELELQLAQSADGIRRVFEQARQGLPKDRRKSLPPVRQELETAISLPSYSVAGITRAEALVSNLRAELPKLKQVLDASRDAIAATKSSFVVRIYTS
jgi:hypothetical protein